MTRQEYQELVKKVYSGKASPEEEETLFEWYDSFGNEQLPAEGVLTEEEQEELFADIQSKTQPSFQKKSVINVIYKIAASVVLAGGLVLAWYAAKRGDKVIDNQQQSIVVPKGQKRKLTLSDGTLIWLNADSKLFYPVAFSAAKREVTLSGEAYFEVKHDASRPFIVHTSTIDIRVLGTVFDVKAYPQDKKVEASLIRGSVQVSVHGEEGKSAPVVLRPNQKFVMLRHNTSVGKDSLSNTNLKEHVVETPKTQQLRETGWRKEILSFENERFADLAIELERWFNIKVIITNPDFKNYRFTGTLNNADLNTVMEALKLSEHFNYRKEADNKIIIY
jgi:ferric-dicitrate binding protein FerR (iron transport regulator)